MQLLRRNGSFRLVDNLHDALVVRRLRNSCREYLTNYKDHISVLQQIRWYFLRYRRASRLSIYRVYLLYNDAGLPVGYGALQLRGGQLFVTECIGREYRGQGYGSAILAELILIARQEKRDLVAEIWAANEPSVALHTKAGFMLVRSYSKAGQELRRYQLKA